METLMTAIYCSEGSEVLRLHAVQRSAVHDCNPAPCGANCMLPPSQHKATPRKREAAHLLAALACICIVNQAALLAHTAHSAA